MPCTFSCPTQTLYPSESSALCCSYFYWTDWGETAKIERASMDGLPSSRQVLISSDIFWPNGLTIDQEDARMYWTDARLHYIHSANLDGSDRRPVVSSTLPHPFAITIFEGILYWTDWQTRAVFACNKSNAQSVRVVTDKLYSPMGIHVFNALRQPKRKQHCLVFAAIYACMYVCVGIHVWFRDSVS